MAIYASSVLQCVQYACGTCDPLKRAMNFTLASVNVQHGRGVDNALKRI